MLDRSVTPSEPRNELYWIVEMRPWLAGEREGIGRDWTPRELRHTFVSLG